jgi:hypothetical protein
MDRIYFPALYAGSSGMSPRLTTGIIVNGRINRFETMRFLFSFVI